MRHSVDLPEPDGPMTTTTSPRVDGQVDVAAATWRSPNHLLTFSITTRGCATATAGSSGAIRTKGADLYRVPRRNSHKVRGISADTATMSSDTSLLQRARAALPSGVRLPQAEWEQRHRWIMRLLWLHVPVIVLFGFAGRATAPAQPGRGRADGRSGLPRHPQLDRPADPRDAGRPRPDDVVGHARAPLRRRDRDALPLLRDARRHQPVPGLAARSCSRSASSPSITASWACVAPRGRLRPPGGVAHPRSSGPPSTPFFVLAASAVSVVSWRIVEDEPPPLARRIEASERRFRCAHRALRRRGHCRRRRRRRSIYDSPSSAPVLGLPRPSERVGRRPSTSCTPTTPIGRARYSAASSPTADTAIEVEFAVRHGDGSYRWVEASSRNLLDDPAVGGVVANFRDITERKALEDQLAHQAFHDPLTGLRQPRPALDRVEHALATSTRRPGARIAVLFLDLDDFKTVNDALGHEAGDALLRGRRRPHRTTAIPATPRRASAATSSPCCSRTSRTRSSPTRSAPASSRRCATPFDARGRRSSQSTPASASPSATATRTPRALLRNADLAMYRAKGDGKGRFEVYEAGMHAAVVERMALKADLRRARRAPSEFEPYYQPIVDLRDRPGHRRRGAGALAPPRARRSSRPTSSSRWPRRPASSSRSAARSCARRARTPPCGGGELGRRRAGHRCRSTCRPASSSTPASSADVAQRPHAIAAARRRR